MSIVVNLVLDGGHFSHIEDAKTGKIITDIGKMIDLPDGLQALQLRVMDLRNRTSDGDNVCPTCLREIPPPPPDLSWRRSKP
jgi:hypothetical protein